jgi:hypothetical protein
MNPHVVGRWIESLRFASHPIIANMLNQQSFNDGAEKQIERVISLEAEEMLSRIKGSNLLRPKERQNILGVVKTRIREEMKSSGMLDEILNRHRAVIGLDALKALDEAYNETEEE